MAENELMKVENQSVKDFLLQYEELRAKKDNLAESELVLYDDQKKMLAEIGDSLDFVKNSTVVLDDTCYSLSCKDAKEYAENVFTLTDGFNKEFMDAVKEAQREEHGNHAITVVNKQEHKELINAPLQLSGIKRELNDISALNKEFEINNILRCAEKNQLQMKDLGIDGKDVVNSTFKLMYEDSQRNKELLVPIAKLEVEMPKPMTLYEIHYLDKDGKDNSLLVSEANLVKTTAATAAIMMKDELNVHIVNRDTKEELDLDSKEFEERLITKLDSKESFEKIKDTAPVITTNNANEVGSVRNGQAVVLETAHDLGELEREAAGSAAETITNEMLRFEEKIGRKITDVELVEEVIKEMITEARIDNKVHYENTAAIDDVGNNKFDYGDIDF